MNKWILVIIIVIIVGAFGFIVVNNNFSDQKQVNSMENTTSTQATSVESSVKVTPVSHASLALEMGGQEIYVDPVEGAQKFAHLPPSNLILITDIHGDHFDSDTVQALVKEGVTVVVPQAVADMLPKNMNGTVVIMKNGEKSTQGNITIEAVAMYNLPESAEAFHPKGRGNGYVLEADGKRVYIAGDTSGIPEMRSLTNIDIAFVPMNLPYTMTVEEAADAVLAFKPKVVHPYHYRGQDGLSDINKFKELVKAKNSQISVELLDFYPQQ